VDVSTHHYKLTLSFRKKRRRSSSSMRYKSQTEYGNLNMCTVACYNVAVNFLHGCTSFSADKMDEIMRQSADFYLSTDFSKTSSLMGVFDIMAITPPPPGILSKDFGGTEMNCRFFARRDAANLPSPFGSGGPRQVWCGNSAATL
jgi:hypothetical protein